MRRLNGGKKKKKKKKNRGGWKRIDARKKLKIEAIRYNNVKNFYKASTENGKKRGEKGCNKPPNGNISPTRIGCWRQGGAIRRKKNSS